jgi:hypothetical protein
LQNKKGRTITFRVDDEVVKLLPNCYKRLKISLALGGVFAPRFAFMGRQAWLRTHLEALGNRLNRETGTLSRLITGVGRAFLV